MCASNMSFSIGGCVLELTIGDITEQDTGAVVNAANSRLAGGGGVDGAIRRKAGAKLIKECDEIRARQGGCSTGSAVITSGGDLKAKFVIHTVGPFWSGGNRREPELLRSAYLNSLKVAVDNNIDSVSFPSISTGAYRYPVKDAALIAVKAVADFLNDNGLPKLVRFVLFDEETYGCYLDAAKKLLQG